MSDPPPTRYPDGAVPEVAALHIEREGGVDSLHDPGVADVSVDDVGEEEPLCHFDDEERERPEREVEHEPDLEELLEAQHYAFPAEASEDEASEEDEEDEED